MLNSFTRKVNYQKAKIENPRPICTSKGYNRINVKYKMVTKLIITKHAVSTTIFNWVSFPYFPLESVQTILGT